MSFRSALSVLVALAALIVAAPAASAQTLPADPGDFQIAINLGGGPAPDVQPTCSPDMIAIGAELVSGTSSVYTTCHESSSATQKPTTGTASNPTLAATDPGFNSGTIDALCDSSQSTDFALSVALSGPTLRSLEGSAFYACAFTMAFPDAQASSLVGTIEINAAIHNSDGVASGSTITVDLDGTVYVTSGTGVFEGAVGEGTFSQTQTFTIPSASGAGGAAGAPSGGSTAPTAAEQAVCDAVPLSPCTAQGVTAFCQVAKATSPANTALCTAAGRRLHLRISTRAGNASTMKLKLKSGAGSARILVPAPPAGKPRGAAKVKAKTKVKMAATVGAQCTVKTSTGAVVGTGTAKGTYGGISIRPKAGAYAGAKWIKATCTKSGKTFSSNKVKVSLT